MNDINSNELLVSEQGVEQEEKIKPYAELSQRDLRSLLFHLLYAVDSFEYSESAQSIVDRFNRGFNLDIPVDSVVVGMLNDIVEQRDELDEQIKPFLVNWRLERIGLATKLILRIALFEMNQKELAPSIVINEAIELAKCFAEKDAFKFVNGVLDEAVKVLYDGDEEFQGDTDSLVIDDEIVM